MQALEPIHGLNLEVVSRPLKFKTPAKTSRDTLTEKPCFYLVSDCGVMGECSIISGLSVETIEEAYSVLEEIAKSGTLDLSSIPDHLPSVKFAVEMMLMKLHGFKSETPFSLGAEGMEINGLVWMADREHMLDQVKSLKDRGFKTIKLKVGALDFKEELIILEEIRSVCPREEYTLRVDANGAFSHTDLDETLEKLKALSEFNIHSIEQPIKQGNTEAMSTLCKLSPIPIALDEELIGVHDEDEKRSLLESIKPQYIILKPSLLGGVNESNTWVRLAEELHIGYWSTSALESNVGLEMIAHWTSQIIDNTFAEKVSGLGTGSLYTNNTDSSLEIEGGEIWNKHEGSIKIGDLIWPLTEEGSAEMLAHFSEEGWEKEIAEFLVSWFNSEPEIVCSTSGSTGDPKPINHTKQHVVASAKDTNAFFSINSNSTLLLSLPAKFIAGKLMLVRAITAGADIIATPPNLDEAPTSQIDFAAFTPHQLGLLIEKHGAEILENYKTILLGGAPIPSSLLSEIPSTPTIFEGFGMTETLTHIAVRRISGTHSENQFTALDSITLNVDSSSRLIIDAPSRGVHNLLTDDIVQLDSPQVFSWNGRYSNIINSGGIKIHPESLERRIADLLSTELSTAPDFAIYGIPHPDLGDQCCLHIDLPNSPESEELLESTLAPLGVKKPRVVRFGLVERNANGKIIRPND